MDIYVIVYDFNYIICNILYIIYNSWVYLIRIIYNIRYRAAWYI